MDAIWGFASTLQWRISDVVRSGIKAWSEFRTGQRLGRGQIRRSQVLAAAGATNRFVVKSGGENVSSLRAEVVVALHLAVSRVAVDDLPVTVGGKVLKYKLRAMLAGS